ncbi:MAG TPA: HNH endonuclease domain-containing protein [Opitutaceae bacterium]|nr:HNH endonuclease domain-containing protein [Opitutaceae bacterium]
MKDNTPRIAFAFDVGHSSIGWSVLTAPEAGRPDILGCGVVLFEKDSALAIQRRLHRQQRRHVRATRQRIARMEKLLVHLGAFTEADLKARHTANGGSPTPWLLAARVLASRGEQTLTWPELWDVLRWYAHNRGYEPIGADEDEEENKEKRAHAREGMEHFEKSTMAETICAWLGQDPLAPRAGTIESYKAKDAAFDRVVVRDEVRRILDAHAGKLIDVDANFARALLDDANATPCPGIRLPRRYTGGLLFGRLATRYHNRIIGRCPLSGGKLPLKDCPEYYRFRWALLLANIAVATRADPTLRPLNATERAELARIAERDGYFTPAEFRKTVRTVTEAARDNLDQMFMDATAAENLVLDPALKLATSNAWIAPLWPHLPETVRRHALNRWRRGRTQSLGELRDEAMAAGAPVKAFDAALAVLCAAPAKRRGKKDPAPPPTPEQILATRFPAPLLGGRAPYARPLLIQAYREAMTGIHPRTEGGCLFETPELRRSRDTRSLDRQTNNHLVRHRLQILGRLMVQLIADPNYAAGDAARVARITLEVNRDLREMAGLTAQDIAKEMNERLRSHSQVSKRLLAELPPGTKINASLIRKARIADDLGWRCPYTGHEFEPIHLVTRKVDLDHIIPRSQRPSDSLDSLVVTFAEINKWKGNRTAWQFVHDEETKTVPGLPQFQIKQLRRYEADVAALDKRGHLDDQRRKKRRIEKLLLARYEEKAGGFTPGQLTQTSQLARLGQQVLRAPFSHLTKTPAFVALPGAITARIRAAWDVLGCLADAAPGVLEKATDAEGRERLLVKTKTEIREITHLHHALDACVLGLATARIPNRGDVWRLLLERRLNPMQRAELESLDLGDFDANGGFRLRDLPPELKKQLRCRLAERRVVQHVPADMSGLRVEENTRGIVKRENGRVFLRQRKQNAEGKFVVNFTDELESKVVGLNPVGKLTKLKGVRVIADNFGVAILDDDKLAPAERFVIIPFARVWQQLQALTERNGGKPPQVWRNGQIIELPSGPRAGRWRIFSIKNTTKMGLVLDLGAVDAIKPNWINVILKSLFRIGTRRVGSSLTGKI